MSSASAAVPPTTTTTTATVSTAAAAGALACFTDADRAALDLRAIELLDRALRVRIRAHFDEAEPATLSGRAIGHHGDRIAGADRRKSFLKILIGDVECEIPDVELLAHTRSPFGCLCSCTVWS